MPGRAQSLQESCLASQDDKRLHSTATLHRSDPNPTATSREYPPHRTGKLGLDNLEPIRYSMDVPGIYSTVFQRRHER